MRKPWVIAAVLAVAIAAVWWLATLTVREVDSSDPRCIHVMYLKFLTRTPVSATHFFYDEQGHSTGYEHGRFAGDPFERHGKWTRYYYWPTSGKVEIEDCYYWYGQKVSQGEFRSRER